MYPSNPHAPAPVHHPYPMRFNPYAYNPLSLGAKIAIGVAGVAAVSLGAFLLWPREAKAGAPGEPKTVPPQPPPPPPPKGNGKPKRPSGHPPPHGVGCYPPGYGGQNRYDTGYWEAGGTAVARQRIFDAFEELGYSTPGDRDTMNALGPDGGLGGGDDVPNPEVRRFQKDYNHVSRAQNLAPGMGGLDEDGMVGPCTLNGLKFVLDNLGSEDWEDVVADAKS